MSADDFGAACEAYDRISPLDPWKISMLTSAKGHIPSQEDFDLS